MAQEWESLTAALASCFKKSFHDLPNPLRRRVIYDFKPFSWDELHPDQRRSLARQIDYQRDPATKGHQEYWFNFYSEQNDLRRQITQWEQVAALTPSELEKKEQRLVDLRHQLAERETLEKLLSKRSFPQYSTISKSIPDSMPSSKLVGLAKALDLLESRLITSVEEIAAWVFLSEKDGGLRCFREGGNANEYHRFYFEPEMSVDYTAELAVCLFDIEELRAFQPKERFITGKALIELWQQDGQDRPVAVIQRLVRSGKLTDLHPTRGATQACASDDSDLPELEVGLFSMKEIETNQETGHVILGMHTDLGHADKESPEERKSRLHQWLEEEQSIKVRGALTRTAKREDISRQALKEIIDRPTD